jgi:hypothetical protein
LNRSYTLLWRKIWSNPDLVEPGKKFSRFEAWLYIINLLTSERLKKCRSRINQAARDACLERYLEDFREDLRKAQQTPFLRGEGPRGWRVSFDWFVANHVNIYAALEGKYDGPPAGKNNGNGGSHAGGGDYFDCGLRGRLRPGKRAGQSHLPAAAVNRNARSAPTQGGAGPMGRSSSA